eukprot:TRINITY_DN8067_c0_g1_i1.p1 TRINITY_DN8067_c0_g1~~TRINITY_DN8067_c0_g1_i1.p1  ORF type:complete len:611 (+),score=271.12 TRINITY_DN8067_c0_g1_i1:37-1869(+)
MSLRGATPRVRPTPRKPPLSTTRVTGVKRPAAGVDTPVCSTPAPNTDCPKAKYRSMPTRTYQSVLDRKTAECQKLKDELKAVEMDVMQTEMTGAEAAAKEFAIRDEKRQQEAEEVEQAKLEQLMLVEGVIADLSSQQEALNRDGIARMAEREFLLLTGKARVEHLVKRRQDFEKEMVEANEDIERTLKERDECLVLAQEAKEKHKQALSKNSFVGAQIKQIEDLINEFSRRGTELDAKKEQAMTSIEEGKRTLNLHEEERRKLHNKIEELKGNIRVFCRIRSPLNSEKELAEFDIEGNKVLTMRGKERAKVASATTKAEDHTFKYDHVFGTNATQEEVFSEVAPLVQSCLDGFKVCIFAYGQTGSGKTYTMEGPANNKGVIPRAVNMIFEKVTNLTHERGFSCSLRCAFLEIYNDQIRDLLGKKTNEPLKVSYSENNEPLIEGLSEYVVDNVATVGELLSTAQSNRAIASTKMNDQSSRSHSLFILKIKTKDPVTGVTLNGVLNLIDLAGSEKVTQSEVQGQRFKEAVAINVSLTHLGDVINSLGTGKHVPFRNCTLTRLLQNSLGGSSKCLMMVNTSPFKEHVEETIKSLRFANRVNNTKIGVAKRSLD